jgi:hypothetical protein
LCCPRAHETLLDLCVHTNAITSRFVHVSPRSQPHFRIYLCYISPPDLLYFCVTASIPTVLLHRARGRQEEDPGPRTTTARQQRRVAAATAAAAPFRLKLRGSSSSNDSSSKLHARRYSQGHQQRRISGNSIGAAAKAASARTVCREAASSKQPTAAHSCSRNNHFRSSSPQGPQEIYRTGAQGF